MSIREKIISAMLEAAETRELTLDKNLTDETKLLENYLDSLGYALQKSNILLKEKKNSD